METKTRELEANILTFYAFLKGLKEIDDSNGTTSYIITKYENFFKVSDKRMGDVPYLCEYYGLDGRNIPQNIINFPYHSLEDRDSIQGEDGQILIYKKCDESYHLFTDSPCDTYLANPKQKWQKR